MRLLQELTEDVEQQEGSRRLAAGSSQGLPTRKVRKAKLDVLLSSVQEIQRLRHVVNRLTANTANSHPTDELSSLLHCLGERRSLHASFPPFAGLIVVAFDVTNRALLECSSRFYDVTGFLPQEVQERARWAYGHNELQGGTHPTMRWRRPTAGPLRNGNAGFEDVYLPEPVVPQYPASFTLWQQLRSGEITSGSAVWRSAHPDGGVWENSAQVWLQEAEVADCSNGAETVSRTPGFGMLVYSSEPLVRVDTWATTHDPTP